MTVLSGKFGVVNGVDTVRNVTINETSSPARGVASNTAQGVLRRHGPRSWNGQFARFGGIPILMPGDFFTLGAYIAPASGVLGGVGTMYEGQAVVQNMQMNWNWQSGELLGQQQNFAGHLELTPDDTADAITDDATPSVLEVCGTKIQYQASSGGDWVQIPALVTAQLSISLPLHAYVNSDTACWTGQVPGAPIDWNVTLTQQSEKRLDAFNVWEDIGLRLFIDNTNYWELLWGHVREFTGINVNRETGDIVGRTINIDMNAASGGALGHILLPGAPGTEWWPTDSRS